METYISARSDRVRQWGEYQRSVQSSYEKTAGTLEKEWKKIEQAHKDLKAKKQKLAEQNGGSNVKDSDVLEINAGGKVVAVSRGTLTQIRGSSLAALFSGRWEHQFHRDAKGRVFLDVNPTCFKAIVDYLNEYKIAPPDDPPNLSTVDPEHQIFLGALLTAFGLDESGFLIESQVLTERDHIDALVTFLAEDDLGKGLNLLYRGTQDGLTAKSFHQKCDDKGPTVTVVKSSEGYIFGGFSDKSWTSNVDGHHPSDKAFLFGMSCHGGSEPVKIPVRSNKTDSALYQDPDYGPTFGWGHDLTLLSNGNHCASHLTSYFVPTSSNSSNNHVYFTGEVQFKVAEIEVFAVAPNAHTCVAAKPKDLALGDFPECIQLSFQTEQGALQEASNELSKLQAAFGKEQVALRPFCKGNDEDLVLLNVSGSSMAVKQSTLAHYPESVFYKQFADPTWNGKRKRQAVSPNEWDAKWVVEWTKKLDGLSEDISSMFQDVTGSELLAFEREDMMHLGIKRPGTVALVVKGIQKLREEEKEAHATTFIEQSAYCVGKILDHMRLKAMSDAVGFPDPGPPVTREPDQQRFKRIVEYYFPNQEEAAQFLG